MKKIAIIIAAITLYSCNKKESSYDKMMADSIKTIDSINAVRTQYNDSIRNLNEQNRYDDLSGSHTLSYQSDDGGISFKGKIDFKKNGRDSYKVSGNAKSGNNTLSIKGNIQRVSKDYLNFDGEIHQNIDGSSTIRNKKTTFSDEKKGKFWRLQNKLNSDGFVDYIDIYF